jgi:DNA-binding NarL/FixJ family response regulator
MDQQQQSPDWALTEREQQVMKFAALGLPDKVIARQLGLAEGTVRLHLHRVYQKLGVTNRTSLVMAIARGWIAKSGMGAIMMMLSCAA